jgi:hypothetical protein
LNNSTTNWTTAYLQGNGSGTSTSLTTSVPDFFGSGGNTTSNTFGSGSIYIPNYTASTNKYLSMDFVSENNATGAFSAMARTVSALWSNSTAVSSFQLVADGSDNLAVGTTVSIYGILKGTDGIVTTSP